MNKAIIITDNKFITGETDRKLFGSFVEHMGSVIYNGIYEPGHPEADENHFRKDVLKYVQELQLSVIRYPGGNYTSAYNWEDTVGPKEKRPVLRELAWQGIEPNEFGLNEFLEWAKLTGAEPILTLNLGTRGIDAARNLLEYCNSPAGTRWSDLRVEHGYTEPHKVKTWCLGNELDGTWQLAAKSAKEYGRLARETAKALRLVDPDIELVAVGSSTPRMESYPEWDRKVLEETYEYVDYISLHHYINKEKDDTPVYLARPLEVEQQIKTIIAACDYVQAKKRSSKTMYLAFDEWNVHKEPQIPYEKWQVGSPFDWCRFTIEDTLVFSSILLSLLRHADRIKIGCQSLLVNTIPLILTLKSGACWRNPTYYPLMHASLFGRGKILNQTVESPCYNAGRFGDVPVLDSVVVLSEENNEITLFCINRGEEQLQIEYNCRGIELTTIIEHLEMAHSDLTACNTEESPETLIPVLSDKTSVAGNILTGEITPYSWNVIRLGIRQETNGDTRNG